MEKIRGLWEVELENVSVTRESQFQMFFIGTREEVYFISSKPCNNIPFVTGGNFFCCICHKQDFM